MRHRLCSVLPLIAILFLAIAACAQSVENIVVDVRGATTPFPHVWEQTFGSGRAILALRESYRSDLREVKKVTAFRYVRFHNIFRS